MILQGKKKKINIPVIHTKIMHMKALLLLISFKHNLLFFHLLQNRNGEREFSLTLNSNIVPSPGLFSSPSNQNPSTGGPS